jgi:WD40 repeat protein
MALGSKGLIKIIDVASAKELHQLDLEQQHVARRLVFSPDAKLFVVGTDEGQLSVWDTQSWQRRHTFTVSDEIAFAIQVTFSADSKRMVVSTCGRQSSALWLWDIPQWKQLRLPLDPSAQASSAALSPDGSQLAIGMLDGAIEVRKLTDFK